MIGSPEVIKLGSFSRSLMTAMVGVMRRAPNGRRLALFVCSTAAIVFGGVARGDIVAQYAFTGATLNRTATTVAPNATAGNIADAPTVNNNPTVVLSRTTGVGYATQPVLSAARANFNESMVRANVFFSFNVSANSGNVLNLSNLTFNVAQGGGSLQTRDYDIRSSLDGFATSLTGITLIPTFRPTFTPVSIDLSGASFQNLSSPLTFQFRFFTSGVSQNVDFDDITLNGTVASTAVPESCTLPVLAIAGAWMIRRRKRRM
jgi:hypothetical protein